MLHDAEKLELKVDMDGGSSNKRSVVKDMKSLSGGERTYTSVCFIMALANVISAPFHCMDEFDVFMDAINRRVKCHAAHACSCLCQACVCVCLMCAGLFFAISVFILSRSAEQAQSAIMHCWLSDHSIVFLQD